MTPWKGSAGRYVLAALAVGLVARLAFGLVYWRDKPLTHDEQEYLAYALNLAAGRGFTRGIAGLPTGPDVEVFARAPLYPAVLAAVLRVSGAPLDRLPETMPPSIKVVQSFASLATVLLIAGFAARAMGTRTAVAAAWLAALYPPLVWSPAYALSETVYSPLILGSAWLAGGTLDRRDDVVGPIDAHRMILAGVLAGVAALARSAALVFPPLVALYLLKHRRVALPLALVLAAGLTVAPWTLRNVAEHGRLVVVAADGGVTFWTGNHPLAIGEGDMAANPRIKAAHAEFRRPLAHLTPEQREPYYYRAAFSHIREHPGDWIGLLTRKAFYTWVPAGPSYTLHSPRYFWLTIASYVPMLLMACAGVFVLARSAYPPRALALLVASSALVCLVFFPQERFRIPVVDPALCVAAAAWLTSRGGA